MLLGVRIYTPYLEINQQFFLTNLTIEFYAITPSIIIRLR